MSTNFNL